MRYGIFSDVHSNIEALGAVLDACAKDDIDTYLCGGDIVGYGADPLDCIDRVRQVCEVTVAGNHDWACVDLISTAYFHDAAAKAVGWTRGRLDIKDKAFLSSLELTYSNGDLVLAHGTLHDPGEFNYMIDAGAAKATFDALKNNICFVGHSHIPGVFINDHSGRISYRESVDLKIEKGKQYIINSGSVGQPRDGITKAAYCVFDTGSMRVQVKRAPYDNAITREKILEAGLPRVLADRLAQGR